MSVRKFLTTRLFLKNLALALLIFFLLSWITMFFLSIYTNRGENISTPDFSGLNINSVNILAKQKTLRIMVRDSVYRPNVNPGTVLQQSPFAGHKIKPGRMIYLTVASVLPEQVEVPKLTDVSLRQARVLLESKGFAFGTVEYRPSEFDGLVLDQKYKGISITPGTRLDNGSVIDLVVGGRGIGGETTVPNLIGLSFLDAKQVIINNFLTPGAMIFDTSVHNAIDTMNAVVWKQIPQADSSRYVTSGYSVDLWLSIQKTDSLNTIE